MADYDRILIQPTAEELEDAVGEAVAAVNGKAKKGRLPWPAPDHDALAAEMGRAPEGWKQWNAEARSGDLRSALGIAWWTDHIGRRHVRLVGCRIGRDLVADLFGPHAANRPPLWRVYPEFAFVIIRGGQRVVNVLCRCGAAGTPTQVGWMGDCCGACHDRREAGDPVPLLWRRAVFCGPNRLDEQSRSLASSPDGDTLAIGQGGRVDLWDVSSGQRLWTLSRSAHLGCLAFAPDGQTLATWSTIGKVILWDVRTGRENASFPTSREVVDLAWSPDGALLALAGGSRTLLLEAHTGREHLDLSGSLGGVTCVAFSPDGSLLAAGTWSGVLRVWDTKTAEERLLLTRPGYNLTSVVFSPDWDGSLFPRHGRPVLGAVGIARSLRAGTGANEGGTLLFFPPALGPGGVPLASPSNTHGTLSGVFTPDGHLFVTGSLDGALRVWSLPEVKEVICLEWHQNHLGQLAFSTDGRWLMTGSIVDGVVRVWPWESLRAACGL